MIRNLFRLKDSKLALATQLINWILQEFNLTQYNMYEDQNEISWELKNVIQQNKRMREALKEIRYIELESLDIDWDEYEAQCRITDYSSIVTYCEIGLGEQDNENDT